MHNVLTRQISQGESKPKTELHLVMKCFTSTIHSFVYSHGLKMLLNVWLLSFWKSLSSQKMNVKKLFPSANTSILLYYRFLKGSLSIYVFTAVSYKYRDSIPREVLSNARLSIRYISHVPRGSQAEGTLELPSLRRLVTHVTDGFGGRVGKHEPGKDSASTPWPIF